MTLEVCNNDNFLSERNKLVQEIDNEQSKLLDDNFWKDYISNNDTINLEISGLDTCAGRAISFYIAEIYGKQISKFSIEGIWNECTYKKIKQSRFLCNQNIGISFKDKYIYIRYVKHKSEPGELRCNSWGYYTTIDLITLKENSILFLEDFMDYIKEFYEENIIYNRNGIKNEILIQTWNTYLWESSNTRPNRKIETVYLPSRIKDDVISRIDNFLLPETKQKYSLCGIPYKLNILFEGYPGSGKSSLIFALASKYKYNIAILSFTNKVDDLSFIKALQKIPSKTFLVLEDIDCLFKERKKNDDIRNMVTFTAILNGLDGLYSKNSLITFMSTNYIENLDPALIRPGRVDHQYKFEYMEKDSINQMFNCFLPDLQNEFESFYKKIRNKKIIASTLQQYLFRYNNIEDIMTNISELDSSNIGASMYT